MSDPRVKKVAQGDAQPPPKDDKKEAPKKDEAKVGGEVKVGAEVKVAEPPKDKDKYVAPSPEGKSPWLTPSRYSAVFEVGYGATNFGNNAGMDHAGPLVGGQLGLNFDLGDYNQFAIRPYGFVRNQWAESDLGQGVFSTAQGLQFGLGADFLYRPHKWFGFGGGLELGGAHWSADEAKLDLNTGITTGGAVINQNGFPVGMDTTAFHIAGLLKACTLGGVCLNARLFANPGGKFTREFTDSVPGNNPAMSFDPTGFQGSLTLDIPQIIGHFTDPPRPRPSKAEPPPENKPAPNDKEPKNNDKPAPVKPEVVPPVAPVELSVSEMVAASKSGIEKAEAAKVSNAGSLKDAQAESKKTSPDVSTLRVYAKSSMDRSAEATAEAKKSRELITKLEDKVAKTEGQDKKDAQAALKQVKDNQVKIDAAAAAAYSDSQKTVEIYAKKAGKDNDLDFSKVEVPPAKPKADPPKLTPDQIKKQEEAAAAARKKREEDEKKKKEQGGGDDAAAKKKKEEEEAAAAKKKKEEEEKKKQGGTGTKDPKCTGPLKDLYKNDPACK